MMKTTTTTTKNDTETKSATSDANSMSADTLINSVARDLKEHEIVRPTVRLIDVAHEKAKEVFDDGFHLVISQALLFFQHRNCELNEKVAGSVFDSEDREEFNLSLGSLYDCDVIFELQNINNEFLIVLAIACYGAIASIVVIVHALLIKDQERPPIQGIFDWTDHIPIIDSLLEIPICLWIAPFVTCGLWLAYLTCCVGIIFLILAHKDAEHEGGNLSVFALTACLVGFDLYRLTGNICQYYVINKSATLNTRKKEMDIINRLSEYINIGGVDEDAGGR